MTILWGRVKARTKRLVRLARQKYSSLRNRRTDRVNLYQLARRGTSLPAGMTVLARPAGTKPRRTVRRAQSDQVYGDRGWVDATPTIYEPEIDGDWVLEIQDVRVASHGEMQLADERWVQFPFLNIHYPRGHSTEGVVMTIDEPVWIVPNGSDAFGHWLLHVMPRIHRARQLDPTKRILTRRPRWNPAGLLEMVGLTVDDVIWYPVESPDGAYVHVAHGTLVSHAAPRGNAQVHPLQTSRFDSMVDDFVEVARGIPSPAGPRLYVSRSSNDPAARRDGCQNRDELEAYFASKGFDVVYPEKHRFVEQVAMFRDATVVVAEGGSGGHNTLFSAFGTKLMYISARMDPRNNHWQRRIADLRTLNYRHLTPTTEFTQRSYTVEMDVVRAAYESLGWD